MRFGNGLQREALRPGDVRYDLLARTPRDPPECSLALRICFRAGDEGRRHFSIRFIDADGKPVINPFDADMEVKLPNDAYFVTRNIVINIQRLKFDEAGQYSIDVSADGHILTRVPLRVMLLEQGKGAPGA